MKRLFIWMSIPLLCLTLNLLPSERAAAARPGYFSPNPSALELIAEVNALRSSSNLPHYQVNAILMNIAQSQAEYISSTGVMTHFDVNGLRPYQHAIEAGYSVAGDLSVGGFFAENLHSGVGLSPAGAVAFWKGDPSQLNTMLSTNFKEAGAGMTLADGVTYFVLDAGAENGTPAATSTATLSSSEAIISTAGAAGTPAVVVMLSTPLDSGEVYHLVQKNEALWSIALAYHTTIEMKFSRDKPF